MCRQSDNRRRHWAGCSRVWNRPHGMFGRRWLRAALSVSGTGTCSRCVRADRSRMPVILQHKARYTPVWTGRSDGPFKRVVCIGLKCLNKWIGSARPCEHDFTTFNPAPTSVNHILSPPNLHILHHNAAIWLINQRRTNVRLRYLLTFLNLNSTFTLHML